MNRFRVGQIRHYANGGSAGALYGLLAEQTPGFTCTAGLPFGAAVWLVLDEGVLPVTGLGPTFKETPPATHAYAFLSHCVYGVVTESLRRIFRRVLA